MSGYSFAVKKSVRRRRIALEDGVKAGAAGVSLGFSCAGGELCAGTDMLPLSAEGLPEGAAQAVYAAGGALLVLQGGRCYVRAAGAAGFSLSSVLFSAPPAAVRVYDGAAGEALLLSDGAHCARLAAAGLTSESVPAFSCAGYAYERLWLATGENGGIRLRFSSFENWRDFAEERGGGGWIDFPDGKGRIAAIAWFENALYVFRERGIQRLDARGDERTFALRDECACARVYGQTVAVCGGRIVFLAEDGLHSFRGGGAEAFAEGFSRRLCGVPQAQPRACYAGGRYYLQADARLPGGTGRALFSLEEDGSAGHCLPGAFSWLGGYEGRAFAVYEGRLCTPAEGAAAGGLCRRRVWEGAFVPPSGGAQLRRLRVDADAGYRLRVACARGTRAFTVRKSGQQSFPVALTGSAFRLRIEAPGGCGRLRAPEAVWTYEEAEYDE